jgi:hypothetical protein
MRQDPCSLENDPLSPVDLSPIDPETGLADCQSLDGCYPLAPTTDDLRTPVCSAVGLESLQTIDGVYEVALNLQTDAAQCPNILPELLEMDAPYFVLVSTEASGVPEVVLQSCNELPDCQVLARELQAAASPRGSTLYNHLLGCGTPLAAEPFILVSAPPDTLPCQAWMPTVSVSGDPSLLRVTIINLSDPPEVSPGCGYIIASSRREPEACLAFAEYGAVRVSAL